MVHRLRFDPPTIVLVFWCSWNKRELRARSLNRKRLHLDTAVINRTQSDVCLSGNSRASSRFIEDGPVIKPTLLVGTSQRTSAISGTIREIMYHDSAIASDNQC